MRTLGALTMLSRRPRELDGSQLPKLTVRQDRGTGKTSRRLYRAGVVHRERVGSRDTEGRSGNAWDARL